MQACLSLSEQLAAELPGRLPGWLKNGRSVSCATDSNHWLVSCRSKVKLPVRLALQISKQLIEAAQHVNRAGYVHRDIKPGNILMKHHTVKLADFGSAINRHTEILTWK